MYFLTDEKTSNQCSSSYIVNTSAAYSNPYCTLTCFYNLEKGHRENFAVHHCVSFIHWQNFYVIVLSVRFLGNISVELQLFDGLR